MLWRGGKRSEAIEMMKACAKSLQCKFGPEHGAAVQMMSTLAQWEHELREAQASQTLHDIQDAQEGRDELKQQSRKRKRDKYVVQ